MRFNIKLLLLFIFCNFFIIDSSAQIFFSEPSNVDYITEVDYGGDTLHVDSLYIFYTSQSKNNPIDSVIPEKLSAKHSIDSLAHFKWFKYNTNTHVFDSLPIAIDSNKNVSLLDTLVNYGCYRVEVTDTSDSTEIHTCWVHLDNFIAYVSRSETQTKTLEFICERIEFDPYLEYHDFIYYNIYDSTGHAELKILNDSTKFKCEYYGEKNSDRETTVWTYPTIKEISNVTDFYFFEFTNFFNNKQSGEYFYDTVWIPTIEAPDTIHSSSLPSEYGDDKGSTGYLAPDNISFTVNADNYDSIIWLFGDTLSPGFIEDYKYSAKNLNSNEHLYVIPSPSYVYSIRIKNKHYGCDTVYSDSIKIDTSRIREIPNVFTPNGDGINELWKVRGISIYYYKVSIHDRWGNVIYKEEGDNNEKEVFFQWDGTMNNEGGRKAPSGIYFYAIEARGWNGKDFKYIKPKKEPGSGIFGSNNLETTTNTQSTNSQNSTDKNTDANSSVNKYRGFIYLFR